MHGNDIRRQYAEENRRILRPSSLFPRYTWADIVNEFFCRRHHRLWELGGDANNFQRVWLLDADFTVQQHLGGHIVRGLKREYRREAFKEFIGTRLLALRLLRERETALVCLKGIEKIAGMPRREIRETTGGKVPIEFRHIWDLDPRSDRYQAVSRVLDDMSGDDEVPQRNRRALWQRREKPNRGGTPRYGVLPYWNRSNFLSDAEYREFALGFWHEPDTAVEPYKLPVIVAPLDLATWQPGVPVPQTRSAYLKRPTCKSLAEMGYRTAPDFTRALPAERPVQLRFSFEFDHPFVPTAELPLRDSGVTEKTFRPDEYTDRDRRNPLPTVGSISWLHRPFWKRAPWLGIYRPYPRMPRRRVLEVSNRPAPEIEARRLRAVGDVVGALRLEGHTVAAIAAALGVSRKTIERRIAASNPAHL